MKRSYGSGRSPQTGGAVPNNRSQPSAVARNGTVNIQRQRIGDADMIKTNFMQATDNRILKEQLGKYSVFEYVKDLSVSPSSAINAYFGSEMNIRKKQVACSLGKGSGVILQAGAMQWMGGDVVAQTNVKGAGDFLGKLVSSKVTGETAIKPRYTSNSSGLLVLEPTYKYILLEDVASWGQGMVIEDGLFLACDDSVQIKTVARSTFSSAALGGEGLFNSMLTGQGIAVLESNVPRDELIVVELQDDQLKVDGSFAIAWSQSLKFTVERTTKTLIGSATSGEGLVNVYRGTGKVLMAPVA